MELGDPQIILLGMDRLDYTKGILHRLRAYESLLDSGLLGPPQAVFVQVASPSRDRVNQYQQLLLDVEALVGRINGEHATLSQPAVRYLHHSYPREEIAALYLAADVMLVTSLRDGMNLVAKEYVCCRHHEDGALVLSEFTGAFGLAAASCCGPRDWIRIRFLEENSLSMRHPLPRLQYTRRARRVTVMSTPWHRVGPIGCVRTNRSPHSDAGMTVVSDLDDEGGRGYHQPAHRRR